MKAVLFIRYFIGFANHTHSFTSRSSPPAQIIYASGQSKQEKQDFGSEGIEAGT